MRSLLIVLLLVAPARAQEPPADEVRDWRLELQPYAFLPVDTSGNLVVQGMDVPIDADLGDLVDKLQFVGQIRLEAWKRWLGGIVDTNYTQTGTTGLTSDGDFLGVSNRTYTADLMLAVRAFALRGSSTYPVVSLEVAAGGRVKWSDSRLSIASAMLDATETKLAGVVSALLPVRLSDRFLVGVRGRFVAPGPDWTLSGGVQIDLSRQWGLELAYRIDWIDQEDPEVDVRSHGPYVGFGFRFGEGPIR
jgi:hypothetical protein